MKRLFLVLLLLSVFRVAAFSCDITITIDPASKKETYKTGEEVIAVVQVKSTHRVCRLDISETTYEPEGFSIVAATDWKELSPGVWERKMKLKVTGTPTGKLVLGVRRKCTKDNNVGLLQLNGIPQKAG